MLSLVSLVSFVSDIYGFISKDRLVLLLGWDFYDLFDDWLIWYLESVSIGFLLLFFYEDLSKSALVW